MRSLKTAFPWIWTGLMALAAVAIIVSGLDPDLGTFDAVPGAGTPNVVLGLVVVVMPVLIAALGALIGTRQPGNPIPWVFYVLGAGILLAVAIDPTLRAGPPTSPSVWDYLAVFASQTTTPAIFYPLFLLLFVFPTGRFLSRRWSWAGWVGWTVVPILLLYPFTDPIGPAFYDWAIENPIGFIPALVFDGAMSIWFGALFAVAFGSIAAIAMRYRVSSDLVRTQTKWVIFAAFLSVLSFILVTASVGEDNAAVGGAIFLSAVALIPVGVFIAITRYKLFEIDRIISRTVTYAVVVGLLALVFAAGVTWIPAALGLGDSPLLVAGSTLAVAALFNPLRRRVQSAVDKRFNRSNYQAQLVSDQFATKLQESLTVEELADVWAETVDEHLQPAASAVWLRKDE